MKSQVKQVRSISKGWLAIMLFVIAGIAVCTSSLSERANAAVPLSNGVDLPPAVPTVAGTPPPPPPTQTPGGPTATRQPTNTPGIPTPVPTGFPTVIPCYTFVDVQPSDWFYEPVNWMACQGVVGGYNDGTFRPNNPTTRGQTTKMLVGAFDLDTHVEGGPHFADVPADNSFFPFVETASFYGVVGGYPCGGPGEPCDALNRPYFRPNNLVTRAQITKIAVLTAQQVNPVRWRLVTPEVATFLDVPRDDSFFPYVETAVANNIIQGYDCGGVGEPCPGRYFRTGADATRAQISKITFLAALLP